jgi:hypothetical protein
MTLYLVTVEHIVIEDLILLLMKLIYAYEHISTNLLIFCSWNIISHILSTENYNFVRGFSYQHNQYLGNQEPFSFIEIFA